MDFEKNKPQKKSLVNKRKVDNADNKIELISCPQNGEKCKNHLAFINENYIESNFYHQNKEYQKSVEALSNAFNKTYELKGKTCIKCAKVFRSTIIQSLEDIHIELKSMSTGLFKTNRYKNSYILAANVLDEFKNETT